jgi:hypothetical protein
VGRLAHKFNIVNEIMVAMMASSKYRTHRTEMSLFIDDISSLSPISVMVILMIIKTKSYHGIAKSQSKDCGDADAIPQHDLDLNIPEAQAFTAKFSFLSALGIPYNQAFHTLESPRQEFTAPAPLSLVKIQICRPQGQTALTANQRHALRRRHTGQRHQRFLTVSQFFDGNVDNFVALAFSHLR